VKASWTMLLGWDHVFSLLVLISARCYSINCTLRTAHCQSASLTPYDASQAGRDIKALSPH
jgi:hypothetical protein